MSDSRNSTSMSMKPILLQKFLTIKSYVDSDVVGEGTTPTPNAKPEYDDSGGLVDVGDPNNFGTGCGEGVARVPGGPPRARPDVSVMDALSVPCESHVVEDA
jgi:hypothetical protein